MTVVNLDDLEKVYGFKNPQTGEPSIYRALQEQQGLRMALVSGSAVALRGLYVSGITTDDTLLSVWEFRMNAAIQPVEHTHRAVISGDDYIYLASTTDASGMLAVLWLDKSGWLSS